MKFIKFTMSLMNGILVVTPITKDSVQEYTKRDEKSDENVGTITLCHMEYSVEEYTK